jgi:hypothetical protein
MFTQLQLLVLVRHLLALNLVVVHDRANKKDHLVATRLSEGLAIANVVSHVVEQTSGRQ